MKIPEYPETVSLSLDLRNDIIKLFQHLSTGISEFTFAGLYLFRNKYGYRISLSKDGKLLIFGEEFGSPFCMIPLGIPEEDTFDDLLKDYHYFKAVSEKDIEANRIFLEQKGLHVLEDRDNFDYLYKRENLAKLAGKKFHKKRNLVNAFINNYNYEECYITQENEKDAAAVLELWGKKRQVTGLDAGDYKAAKEALELREVLNLCGCLTYVDGIPAAYSMGEMINKTKSFAVHFEKAGTDHKGIYQFINKSFAQMIGSHFSCLNREQDLGDPGLRQAKMSYRPDGFVKKYKLFTDRSFCRCEKCCKNNDE